MNLFLKRAGSLPHLGMATREALIQKFEVRTVLDFKWPVEWTTTSYDDPRDSIYKIRTRRCSLLKWILGVCYTSISRLKRLYETNSSYQLCFIEIHMRSSSQFDSRGCRRNIRTLACSPLKLDQEDTLSQSPDSGGYGEKIRAANGPLSTSLPGVYHP